MASCTQKWHACREPGKWHNRKAGQAANLQWLRPNLDAGLWWSYRLVVTRNALSPLLSFSCRAELPKGKPRSCDGRGLDAYLPSRLLTCFARIRRQYAANEAKFQEASRRAFTGDCPCKERSVLCHGELVLYACSLVLYACSLVLYACSTSRQPPPIVD